MITLYQYCQKVSIGQNVVLQTFWFFLRERNLVFQHFCEYNKCCAKKMLWRVFASKKSLLREVKQVYNGFPIIQGPLEIRTCNCCCQYDILIRSFTIIFKYLFIIHLSLKRSWQCKFISTDKTILCFKLIFLNKTFLPIFLLLLLPNVKW